MATLIGIGGKPGAGKTTLARVLGRDGAALVVCEDESLATLGFVVRSFDDHRAASGRLRALWSTSVPALLRLGGSAVLDFAANHAPRQS